MEAGMDRQPLVSVLINNYNYGRFLAEAIDSALNQTYPHVEVIVVDDGSTDDSRQIIAGYGDRILPVLKENGGQASAMNAGFAVSSGKVICLLDADDLYEPEKVSRVVGGLVASGELERDILAYHPLLLVDADGLTPAGGRPPTTPRYHGNFYRFAQHYGYVPFVASHPSGVSITRSLGLHIFPLPEAFSIHGDHFLVRAAGLIGEIRYVDDALARYRVHGANYWFGRGERMPRDVLEIEEQFLNQKLRDAERNPILCYFGSMASRDFYLCNGEIEDLFLLIFRVMKRYRDLRTLRFAVKTSLVAALWLAKSLRGGRHHPLCK